MTAETEAPRANKDADPCPRWCTADHAELLVTGRPELGSVKTHRSDPMTAQTWPTLVKVCQYPGEAVTVQLQRIALIQLLPEEAVILAGIIEAAGRHGEGAAAQLAEELRAAAAIARESN